MKQFIRKRKRRRRWTHRSKTRGGLDLHAMLPKVALTPPGFRYMGPNNPLEEQVDLETGIPRPGHEPKNNMDRIALKHDLLYHKAEQSGRSKNEILRMKHEADRIFIAEAEATERENWYQRFWNWAARNLIKAKLKLGMGQGAQLLGRLYKA
jgi:Phospholipase A2-like domain